MLPRLRLPKKNNKAVELGNGADIAFLLVVLSAYFSIFNSLEQINMVQLSIMILLGVVYLMLGIYGFSLLQRYNQMVLDLAYFLIQILLGGGILLMGAVGGRNLSLVALLFLPLVVQSVLVLPRYWMLFANICILIAYTTVIFSVNRDGSSTGLNFPLFFTAQIFIVFFTQMAVNESKSREEVERLVTELADANEHLRAYALKIEELAVTQERNRMAREIHDGLGHYMTSIHIHLQAAEAVLKNASNPGDALDGIHKAQTLAKNALTDVRQSVSTLRSPLVGHLPLSEILQDILNQTATGDIVVRFEMDGEEREIPPNISWTILRATQEAVNNAVKYSQCSTIEVLLQFLERNVKLTITDDGVGSDNPTGGYGLLGLQERIHLLNGELSITTSSNDGFKVEIGVPLT